MIGFTNNPRPLTADEKQLIQKHSRMESIKLHRKWTNSTLMAAIIEVDALQSTSNVNQGYMAGWNDMRAIACALIEEVGLVNLAQQLRNAKPLPNDDK